MRLNLWMRCGSGEWASCGLHDGKGCGWPAASNFEQGDIPDTDQPLRKFAYLLSTGLHTDFVRNFWLLFHQCILLWENDDCFSRKQVRALIESTSGLFGLKAAGTVLDRAVRIAQWPRFLSPFVGNSVPGHLASGSR
jgi:hypothetical protein